MFNINVEDKSVLKNLGDLSDATKKAYIATSTKLAQQGATQAKRIIRDEYNIKTKYLNRNISTTKAHEGVPAKIIGKGRGIPIIAFGTRKTRSGIKVEVKKGSSKLLSGTFRATMPSGHLGVFERAANCTRRTKGRAATSTPNLPIKEKFGPGAAVLLNSKNVFNKINLFIKNNYDRLFKHELDYRMKK